MLPVNAENKVDWDFMSDFMKQKELAQVMRYLKAKAQ